MMSLHTSHTDDLLLVGDGSEAWQLELERLKEALHLSVTVYTFRYCGKNSVLNEDFSITIGQVEPIDQPETIDIPKESHTDPQPQLGEADINALRNANGERAG